MGIWLVSMAILTVVTAQEIYDSYNHSTDKERHKLIRDINFPMETAVLFYDAEGNLLYGSESDMMYFNYYTQEEWDEGMDTTVGLHYGWIDIREGKNAENRESDDQFSTGSNSYSYITSDVDRTGKLEWQLQFDRSAEHAEEDLVTVYLTYPEMWDYEGKGLEYSENKYNSLAALTESMVSSRKDGDSLDYQDNRYKLNELLVFDKVDGTDIASGDGTTAYYLVTAIRSNPLACSICALRDIYIVTGLLALALLLLTRNAIKKYLIQPTTK